MANTVIVSPKTILPGNCDKTWIKMPVPKLNRVTGAWAWFLPWYAAYDERLVPMTVTGYIRIPNKPRYTALT